MGISQLWWWVTSGESEKVVIVVLCVSLSQRFLTLTHTYPVAMPPLEAKEEKGGRVQCRGLDKVWHINAVGTALRQTIRE